MQEAKDQLQVVLDAVTGCISWVSSDLHYFGVNQYLPNYLQLKAIILDQKLFSKKSRKIYFGKLLAIFIGFLKSAVFNCFARLIKSKIIAENGIETKGADLRQLRII